MVLTNAVVAIAVDIFAVVAMGIGNAEAVVTMGKDVVEAVSQLLSML